MKRNVKVQIMLTAEEKETVESEAKKQDYDNLSSFVRKAIKEKIKKGKDKTE